MTEYLFFAITITFESNRRIKWLLGSILVTLGDFKSCFRINRKNWKFLSENVHWSFCICCFMSNISTKQVTEWVKNFQCSVSWLNLVLRVPKNVLKNCQRILVSSIWSSDMSIWKISKKIVLELGSNTNSLIPYWKAIIPEPV